MSSIFNNNRAWELEACEECSTNCDTLWDILKEVEMQLDGLRENLSAHGRRRLGQIPGIDGHTGMYAVWPTSIQCIYYWPKNSQDNDSHKRCQNPTIAAFLEDGASKGFLSYRRIPEGYDFNILHSNKIYKLLKKHKLNISDFGKKFRNNEVFYRSTVRIPLSREKAENERYQVSQQEQPNS